jgi:hypothetical protein
VADPLPGRRERAPWPLVDDGAKGLVAAVLDRNAPLIACPIGAAPATATAAADAVMSTAKRRESMRRPHRKSRALALAYLCFRLGTAGNGPVTLTSQSDQPL